MPGCHQALQGRQVAAPGAAARIGFKCTALVVEVAQEQVHADHIAQRGALKPDARGRSWRGDLPALQRLMAAEAAP